MKLNKRWQNIFRLKTYTQYDNSKVYERLINRNLYAQLMKFKKIFFKYDDRFRFITTSDFCETHVKKSTKIKRKNQIISIFIDKMMKWFRTTQSVQSRWIVNESSCFYLLWLFALELLEIVKAF